MNHPAESLESFHLFTSQAKANRSIGWFSEQKDGEMNHCHLFPKLLISMHFALETQNPSRVEFTRMHRAEFEFFPSLAGAVNHVSGSDAISRSNSSLVRRLMEHTQNNDDDEDG